MPKFTVNVTETSIRVFEVDALNAEDAKVKAMDLAPSSCVKIDLISREATEASRKLAPQEKVFAIQLDNIRRDYARLANQRKLPDGHPVEDADAITMMHHLAKLHNALLEQSGLDLPLLGEGGVIDTHLGETTEFFKEHLGDPTTDKPAKPAKPKKAKPTASIHGLSDHEKKELWEKAATKLGWKFDEDYKGWVKPENIKEGSRPGEWDAFVRDLTAEDACNEEDITTLEEAVVVIEGGEST